MALKIFVDFDGTITRNDVGNEFFLRFGGSVCEGLVAQYHRGEITAQECFRREAAAIGAIVPAELDGFLAGQEIDPAFPRFVEFCRIRGIDLTVVSDGLDYYINAILGTHGIKGLTVFSNVLELGAPDAEGRAPITLRFPNTDAECGVCASCKRNVMLTRAGDDDILVYVGEGFSDRCPAGYADVVFAKDALQAYCQQENISYFLYASFDDVMKRMMELIARKRMRQRRRAELRRREVFSSEP